MFGSPFYSLGKYYIPKMEWKYEFTDRPGAVPECLAIWKRVLETAHGERYTVVFDITTTHKFGIKALLQMSGFIALNRKKIKAQTDKVKIVLQSAEQERVLRSGLRMTPFLVDFEIVRAETNLPTVHDASASR